MSDRLFQLPHALACQMTGSLAEERRRYLDGVAIVSRPVPAGGGKVSAACAPASGSTEGSETRIASIRRRMRAVTGSSAEPRRFPIRCGAASMVCAALRVLIWSASSETLGRGSLLGTGFAPERQALIRSRKVVSVDRKASWRKGLPRLAW